jgi:hypothetical protein
MMFLVVDLYGIGSYEPCRIRDGYRRVMKQAGDLHGFYRSG